MVFGCAVTATLGPWCCTACGRRPGAPRLGLHVGCLAHQTFCGGSHTPCCWSPCSGPALREGGSLHRLSMAVVSLHLRDRHPSSSCPAVPPSLVRRPGQLEFLCQVQSQNLEWPAMDCHVTSPPGIPACLFHQEHASKLRQGHELPGASLGATCQQSACQVDHSSSSSATLRFFPQC